MTRLRNTGEQLDFSGVTRQNEKSSIVSRRLKLHTITQGLAFDTNENSAALASDDVRLRVSMFVDAGC